MHLLASPMKTRYILLSLLLAPFLLTADGAETPKSKKKGSAANVVRKKKGKKRKKKAEDKAKEEKAQQEKLHKLVEQKYQEFGERLKQMPEAYELYRAGYEGDDSKMPDSTRDDLSMIYLAGASFGAHANTAIPIIERVKKVPDHFMGMAALSGNMEIVRAMLDKGIHPDHGIAEAAMGGHMEIVEHLMEKGATADMGLMGACAGGYSEIAELMLEKGAKLMLGMHAAGYSGSVKLVKMLLKEGGDPTPCLNGAALGGHDKLVKFLIKKGADSDKSLNYAVMANLLGLTKEEQASAVTLLLQNGADPNKVIHEAAGKAKPELLKALLEHQDLDINAKDARKKTPLDCAVAAKKSENAELIRQAGGKPASEL